ncbi:ATP-binding protein [Marinospirillum sp.]|uniref:ATP-binding protein n=1 Tax=Marinospirillum sp. TaxID=2183934 RepID=UPI00384F26A1
MRLLYKRLDNIFFRVYLGVFTALIVILLLGSLLINFANQVRQEAHHEQLLQGLFASLAADYQQSQLEPSDWLKKTQAGLDLNLTFSPFEADAFSKRQLKRLDEKRPLIETTDTPGQLQVFYPTHQQGLLFQATLQRLHEQQAQASAQLVGSQLQSVPQGERSARLEQLSNGFAYPLHLTSDLPEGLNPLRQERLARGEPILLYQEQPSSLTSYVALGGNQWLKLGPVDLFNPYPLPLLGGILLTSLLVLGVSIWWFLHGLGNRLRSLERVSSQLAAGNLKARVTEQKKDFIGKLASAFNHMAEQIQRLLRTQQEMIHAVSHELRTPVARIRFGLQMIEDLSEDQAPHQQLVRQVQGIDKDIDELDTLIDEILTYARLGQEKLQLQFVEQEVIGLLDDVVSGFQRVNPNMELELKVNNPGNFSTEADLEGRYFQRAIQNLVGNAVRYARSNILITCHLEADNLRVDVEDDGPGIPEEDWQRVFMPFSRLDDSRTRSSGGYGLGLSIVQRIIYWHRGSALVDRSPSLKGARFCLIFPKQQADDLPPLDLPPQ